MRRLVLFDIDGTLLSGGPAKEAFRVALTEAYGTTGAIEVHDFSGKTDPQIARELLTDAGFSDEEVDAGFPALWSLYLEGLELRLPDTPVDVLGGVVELVEALADEPGIGLGLVTGNILGGARLKLGSGGLDESFLFDVGGYGSDSEARNDLPGIAIERARARFGVPVEPDSVVVVGDTPRDVECGRFAGCRTVGVATGNFSVAALERAEADHVFEDLGAVDDVLRALVGG